MYKPIYMLWLSTKKWIYDSIGLVWFGLLGFMAYQPL